ncbi:X-box-binding protein 1 [Fopius arisanus]|uniref:X-box-binding protein 1 n=1 Tax=Fopius arisanus TaxID=64838 RepID=A0A0C9RD49_9HYME|nr:PREDICTED: X-box-binding protein 1 [Fopius arisanus]
MSFPRSVIITLPKGMQKATLGNEINLATSILGAKAKMEARKMKIEEIDDSSCRIVKPDEWLRGKKRRLDHLTWEEKLQRKKLKNRVAAQTSRDRKKAKLDELEDTVRALHEQNDLLSEECALLRSQNETLLVESQRLKFQSQNPTNSVKYCESCQNRVDYVKPTLGSAASPNPLLQGGKTQSAPALTQNATVILKILTLYLLSRSSLEISKETTTSSDLKNSPRAFCERLPQKWKQILIQQMSTTARREIPLKNMTIQSEWWGRHQKMWKPPQLAEA